MKLISLGLEPPEQRNTPPESPPQASPANWEFLFGGLSSESGEIVNETTALAVSTVLSCVQVLCRSVSSLPLKLYRKTETGRIEATDQPLHYLLSVSPNIEVGAPAFFHVLVRSMALKGNAYAEIERNGAGDVIGLWTLDPYLTTPVRINGRLKYQTTDGMVAGALRYIEIANMLHIPLFPSSDGIAQLALRCNSRGKQSVTL